MDALFNFVIAGLAMMLFAIPLMVIYSVLERKWREDQIRRQARRILMKQMEQEREFEERASRVATK